jgi:DNA primase
MRIPSNIIEDIRTAADIHDVVSGYVSLKKKGQNHFGLCPFHNEKTPSFSVNTQKQIFHCFGCGEGGNSISFIMKVESLSFVESAKYLAKRFNIEIPESKETEAAEKAKLDLYNVNRFATDFFKKYLWENQGKVALEYLTKRDFSKEIIQEYELGFAPSSWDGLIKAAIKFGFSIDQLKAVGLVIPNKKGGYYDRFRERIIFPIHNLSGLIAGFGGRIFKDEPNSPKYINSPETSIYQKSRVLYGLFQNRESIRKKEKSLLVEGYADVMGLAQAGIQNAVASSGTSLTTDQARLLLRYSPNSVILYDGDLAGANAALRGVDILLQEGVQVRVAVLPQGSDPDSFIKEEGKDALLELINKSRELIDFKIYAYSSAKPLKTPQQLADLVNLLAESVADIQDEVVRNLYIQEIAQKLNLSETVVFRAVSKKKRFKRRTDEPVPVQKKENVSLRFQTERELIEISMRFPQMIAPIYEHLNLDEIKFAEHKHILSQIYDQFVNTGKINQQNVLDFVEDGKLQKFIVNAMMKEEELKANIIRKWTNDCLRNIKIYNLRDQVEVIRTELKTGEEKKNNKKVISLSEKWTSLQKLMEELKTRQFITEDID